MIEIARNGNNGNPISLNVVSDQTSISRRYLEQVVIPLRSASLLRGMSGKNGGYRLGKPAEEIKVGEIIQAAIGKINIVNCIGDPSICLKTDVCECRPLYSLINYKIVEAMNEFTLADLIDKKWVNRIKLELDSLELLSAEEDDCSQSAVEGCNTK
jgi:Rrf2 family protein